MARRLLSYHVTPRYTPSSPAQVRREIAEAVAVQEKRGYEHEVVPFYVPDEKARNAEIHQRACEELGEEP